LRLDKKEAALRTEQPVIVPGKSSESPLIQRITSHDADENDAAAEVEPQVDSGSDRITHSAGSIKERFGESIGRTKLRCDRNCSR